MWPAAKEPVARSPSQGARRKVPAIAGITPPTAQGRERLPFFVDGLLARGADMGVDLCRGDRFVAQQFLDIADISAMVQQVRGIGVAQCMGSGFLPRPR